MPSSTWNTRDISSPKLDTVMRARRESCWLSVQVGSSNHFTQLPLYSVSLTKTSGILAGVLLHCRSWPLYSRPERRLQNQGRSPRRRPLRNGRDPTPIGQHASAQEQLLARKTPLYCHVQPLFTFPSPRADWLGATRCQG